MKFSVQWDGVIEVPDDGIRLNTLSENGSRLWIDLDGDGNIQSDREVFNNGWGIAHDPEVGLPSPPLTAGRYTFRVQYESDSRNSHVKLIWWR